MGLVKTLKKVFKGRKKRDRDQDQRVRNQGHQRSIRGGIYEPYRAHFPLKTQQTNYDNVDQYYASWDHPAQQQQVAPQQQKFGPKLMTAGPATINQNRNYEQHHYGMTPVRNYEQHEFQPNSFQQRQANYEATRIAKFGETNPFQAPASVAGHENYESHQLPQRSSQSFNHGTPNPYQNHYPLNPIQRSGSNASLSAHINSYNPYTNHVLQRPRRPSSAILPTRSASDVGFMNSRPIRPGSSQADMSARIHSPMRRQVTSPFVEQQQQQQQRVMSPGPANPIALQLRGSQANLQQALRMHEDITRQTGAQAAPELDATMKIMQTCLDMLDSISGLVERSTTPLPTQMSFQPTQPDQQNFINHLENKQPVKSALKQRPTLQKSSNSAFTQLRQNESERESEDFSPLPKPQYEIEMDSSTERVELGDFNSPGPSEGGTSVDSGFGKAAKPTSQKSHQHDLAVAKAAREAKIAQNMAKFETMLLRSTNDRQNEQNNHTDKETGLTSGPLLSSLSQLRLNA